MADPYLLPSDVRTRLGWQPGRFDDGQIEERVGQFERLAERYCGVAFTPRVDTATVTTRSYQPLYLPWAFVRSVSALSYVSGWDPTVTVTFDSPTVAALVVGYSTVAEATPTIPDGSTATATVEHGMDSPPAGILIACTEFVRAELLAAQETQPRNALYGITSDGVVLREVTRDESKGAPTRWQSVNDPLDAERQQGHRIGGMA